MGFFSEIPRHNQLDILKKLDFKDFAKFKQCSQESVEITKNFKHLLPLKAEIMNFEEDSIKLKLYSEQQHNIDSLLDEPIRFEIEDFCFGYPRSKEQTLEEFCDIMQERMKVESLNIHIEKVDPSAINSFIKHFNVSNLYISYCNSALLPELTRMRQIKFYTAEMRESDFLLLEATNASIVRGGLKLSSVNKFLKQWIEGKRRVEQLEIDPLPRDHLEMLNGLEYTIHYLPGMDQLVRTDDYCTILSVYSIARDNGKKLFISIDCFEDDSWDGQMRILVGEADDDDIMTFMRAKYSTHDGYD